MPNQHLPTLQNYHETGDLDMYFSQTVLPYKDRQGRQRVALISHIDTDHGSDWGDIRFIYRPNLLDSNYWSESTFKKGVDRFDYRLTMLSTTINFNGNAWVCVPKGLQTYKKGITAQQLQVRCVNGNLLSNIVENPAVLVEMYSPKYYSLTEARRMIQQGEADTVAVHPKVAVRFHRRNRAVIYYIDGFGSNWLRFETLNDIPAAIPVVGEELTV